MSDLTPTPATLTPLQEQALALMMAGETQGAIAQKLEVHRYTVARWSKLPEFQQAMGEMLEGFRDGAQSELQEMVSDSLAVIKEALHDPECPPHVRVGAAFKVLDLVFGKDAVAPLPTSHKQVKQRGLSPETIREIEERFLGIERPTIQLKTIPPETLKMIREQVYGIYDTEATGQEQHEQDTEGAISGREASGNHGGAA